MTRCHLNPRYAYERRHRILPWLQRQGKELPRRLRWPLRAAGIPVTANGRRLAALRGIHRGQRAFIIGNGPSLCVGDLGRLKGEITFACNKIYLAYDETDWRPTYYTVYDVLVAQNNHEVIRRLRGRRIFGRCVQPYFRDSGGIIYVDDLIAPPQNGEPSVRFSKNLLLGVYGGWTTLYLQMQLAWYMGVREIYVIGLDFSFHVPKPTGELSERGETVVENAGEVNHFHPEYRKPGEKWTLPRLDLQYKAFSCAKTTFEEQGGFIANASRSTALDLFPLVEFESLFSDDEQ